MTEDDLQMEHGFLKAPWEVLMRSYRAAHKGLIKEAEGIAESTSALFSSCRGASSGAPIHVPTDDVDALITRLEALQARVDSARAADTQGLQVINSRIEHLAARSTGAPSAGTGAGAPAVPPGGAVNGKRQQHPLKRPAAPAPVPLQAASQQAPDAESAQRATLRWEKVRLDRVLVDYMLRSGLYRSGMHLAETERITSYADVEIFREARSVIAALRVRDCSAALAWCTTNRRRLAKAGSTFEFQLHRQVCIEHARRGEKEAAIAYARTHLTNTTVSMERHKEIGSIMLLVVFKPSTSCQPYKNLYSAHKWLELEELFKIENYKLHGLTWDSTLEILLKTGLSTLKTRKCGLCRERNSKCPVCNEPYSALSVKLPRAQHINSVLVCSMSGAIMDENNPPMALPNGNVYGFNALQDLALRNGNQVVDPKTDESFAFSRLRKCYIM